MPFIAPGQEIICVCRVICIKMARYTLVHLIKDLTTISFKNYSKSFHLKGEAVDLLHNLGSPLHLLALEAEEALGDNLDCLFSN